MVTSGAYRGWVHTGRRQKEPSEGLGTFYILIWRPQGKEIFLKKILQREEIFKGYLGSVKLQIYTSIHLAVPFLEISPTEVTMNVYKDLTSTYLLSLVYKWKKLGTT